MGHIHSIYDTDPHFAIDAITRVITNKSETKTCIVQGDHNSERFTFECPRMVDGHDMSTCNQVRIQYMNIDQVTREKHVGSYEADDLQISPAGDDTVIFSWLISANATQYVGPLSFVVRMVCCTGTTIDYAWHTAIHAGINVVEGIDGGEPIKMQYADIMAEWQQELSARALVSLEQTKKSTDGNGENIWTATFGDGRRVNFSVRNGENAVEGNAVFTAEVKDGVMVVKASGVDGAPYVLLSDERTGEAHKLQIKDGKLYIAGSEVFVLSEAGKDEIIDDIKTEVHLIKTAEQPTFVGTIKECTDPERVYVLPDGYIYAHGIKYGKQYTNILPTLTYFDGSLYNDGAGCKHDTVVSQANGGVDKSDETYFATGLIPIVGGDVLRIAGIAWGSISDNIIVLFDSNKSIFTTVRMTHESCQIDENGVLVLDTNVFWDETKSKLAYMRISVWEGSWVTDFSPIIMTINEEIVEGEVEIEGFYNTGLVYQPFDNEDRMITLENDVAELKESGGGNVTFDYSAYGLPELALTGNISEMTKDNAVTLDYVYGNRSGTCTCKWQGASSIAYPKKNYTIKFDNAFEAVEGWGEQKKYCFKANWIDHSHARNIVSAKLWGDIVRSRTPKNTTLEVLPNCGAIDGFPCVITINGKYQGLYTFNIPKDGWMFGMGSGTNEAILCANNHSSATAFWQEAVVDGTDFDLEYVTDEENTDWVTASLNRLINACNNSDGTDLDTTLAQYIDWQSAIDYYIYVTLLSGGDMIDKNYILATYDGTKWFFSAYDIDSTYGLYYNGQSFGTGGQITANFYSTQHRLMKLIVQYKKDALKARYTELRSGVMSDMNVLYEFSNFMGRIPERIYLSDTEVWPTIPSTGVNHLAQITTWYQTRAKIIDAQMESL